VNTMLLGVAVGAVLGAAAGFFAYPTLYAPYYGKDAVVPVGAGAPRASGQFAQAAPADRVRYGSGGVTVGDDRVELGDDFRVAPGPKYHLYLVPERDIDADTRVDESMFVDLGPLKAFSGRQAYPVPAGVEVQEYGSVVIWSEQLNALISPAELKSAP
jgi:hypothetical protein